MNSPNTQNQVALKSFRTAPPHSQTHSLTMKTLPSPTSQRLDRRLHFKSGLAFALLLILALAPRAARAQGQPSPPNA